MLRYMWGFVLVLGIAMAVAIGGCSKAKEAAETAQKVGEAAKFAKDLDRKGEATIKTEDGEAKVEVAKKGDDVTSMTVTGKDGQKATFTSGAAMDASKTGIEPYPGAEQAGGGSAEGGEGTVGIITLTTTDSFEKVAKFYKDKYPDAQKMETSGNDAQTLVLTISEAPNAKAVTVSTDKDSGKVNIVLMSNVEAPKPPAE